MSRPLKKQSITGASSATGGEAFKTSGHNSLGLLVEADNLDGANDTLDVQLEMRRPNGEWAEIRDKDGTKVLQVSASDFVQTGTAEFTVFLYAHGVPAPEVRANITSFTDNSGGDLTVDAYVTATNNTNGSGHSYD